MERSCRTCKHAGWDPDGNYCAAPKVLEKHKFGLNIGSIPIGVKTFCEAPGFPLWEKKPDET